MSSKHQRRSSRPSGRSANPGSSRVLLIGVALIFALASFLVFSTLFGRHGSGGLGAEPTRAETHRAAAPALAGAATNSGQGPEESAGKPESIDDVNQGTELFAHGKFAEAADAYGRAVKLSPDDETAHFNLAVALARMGKLEEAKQEYEEALRLFPDYGEAHNNLGNILVGQGQLPAGLEHLKAAVQAAPDSASAHNNLGRVLMLRGERPQAVQHFAEAVRLTPDYLEAHCNLGYAYLGEGKTNEAAAQFTAALELKPGFEPATRGLARARGQSPAGASEALPPIPLRID